MLGLKTSLVEKGVKPGYAPKRHAHKIDVGHNSLGDVVAIEIEKDNGQAGLGLADSRNEWYLMDNEAQLVEELSETITDESNKSEFEKLIQEILKEVEIDPNSFFLIRVVTTTNSIE